MEESSFGHDGREEGDGGVGSGGVGREGGVGPKSRFRKQSNGTRIVEHLCIETQNPKFQVSSFKTHNFGSLIPS